MIVLKEQVGAQTFKFIPRELVADSMTITGESTNVTDTYNITPTIDRYYLSVSAAITLVEGEDYVLKVFNGGTEVYRDKIYCTNQTIEDYTINENQYTSNTTTNEYVIID